MENIVIRDAAPGDVPAILDIYRWYVEHTAITFETHVPSTAEFEGRMRSVMARYPYLVLERDGVIEGYAYAGPLNPREAYNWTCELTIYLRHDARKCGFGRKLYTALEQALIRMGILTTYACIGSPIAEDEYLTHNSEQFHAHLGFRRCGTFSRSGYKFGRWYNMIWMEKNVGEHLENQPPVVWYPDL